MSNAFVYTAVTVAILMLAAIVQWNIGPVPTCKRGQTPWLETGIVVIGCKPAPKTFTLEMEFGI